MLTRTRGTKGKVHDLPILDPEGERAPVAPPPAERGGKLANAPHAWVSAESVIGQPLSAYDPPAEAAVPPGGNFMGRYKAFQLYVAGERQADIARVLGVSRNAVNVWKRQDEWDRRLEELRDEAGRATHFIQGNVLAATAAKLRTKLETRIHELELLCAASVPPAVRLGAIKLWVELATKLTDQAEKERVANDPEQTEEARPGLAVTGLEFLRKENDDA